jgi:hypothetical protein
MARWYAYSPHDYDFAKIHRELSGVEWPEDIEACVERIIAVVEDSLPVQ